MEPARKIARFGYESSDEDPAWKYTRFGYESSDESSDEFIQVWVPARPRGPYGITGLNLQYPLSKKIWLMWFFSRVHYGWLYNYRHIPKMIFFFCNADQGTFHPNIICH